MTKLQRCTPLTLMTFLILCCQPMCVWVFYTQLLKGIRAETVIIPLSLTCHYCLQQPRLCVSFRWRAHSCMRRCPQTPTFTHAHTCPATKVFLTVSLFNRKHLLSRATWGIAPPPSLPEMLSSGCSELPCSLSLSVVVVIAFCCSKSFKTKWRCSPSRKETRKVRSNEWHAPFCHFISL